MKRKYKVFILTVSTLLLLSCESKEYKGPSHVDIPESVMNYYTSWKTYLLKEPSLKYENGYTKALIVDYKALNDAIKKKIKENPGLYGLQTHSIYMDCDFVYFSGYANKAVIRSKGSFSLTEMCEYNDDESHNIIYEKDHKVQNDWLKVKATNNGYESDFYQNKLEITVSDNDTGKPRKADIALSDRNSGTSFYIYQEVK